MLSVYIKPTRYVHSSGYRTFECGYIDEEAGKKYVITNGSDHVYTDYVSLYDPTKAFGINMDLTKSGYIRIWSTGEEIIKWANAEWASSDMSLTIGEPKITENMEVIEL